MHALFSVTHKSSVGSASLHGSHTVLNAGFPMSNTARGAVSGHTRTAGPVEAWAPPAELVLSVRAAAVVVVDPHRF